MAFNIKNLSKSQYCKATSCLRKVWLHRNKKKLAQELSLHDKLVIKRGYQVDELARELFPNGELIQEGY